MITGFEDWLPPVDRRVKDDAKHTVLLLLRSHRAAKLGLISAVALAAGVAGISVGFDATGPAAFWAVAGVVATVFGLAGSIAWSFEAVSWRRDHRRVRTTGWRRGTVRVASLEVRYRSTTLSMLVEYEDGSCIRLWSGNPGTNPSALRGRNPQVLVGGTGRRMVVLLRGGGWERVPIQAKAVTYRWMPD